jgi:hypothetical protein
MIAGAARTRGEAGVDFDRGRTSVSFDDSEWDPFFRGGSWERAGTRLIPRVRKEQDVESDVVQYRLGNGLISVLSLQRATSVGDLTMEMVRIWRVDRAELWAVARHNLRRRVFTPTVVGPILQVTGGSPFTASHLLRLDEARPAPRGVLVLLPFDDTFWFWPVDERRLAQVGAVMRSAIGEFHSGRRRLPERLSDDVMWWHEGRLERVRFSRDGSADASPRFNAVCCEAGV